MKKTIRNCLLGCICFLVSFTLAFAEDKKTIVPEHGFGVDLDISYYDYEEDGLMEEDGIMYGIVGNYNFHSVSNLMIDLSLKYSFGELDYDGRTWGGTPVTADTDNWFVEYRGLVGYDVVRNGNHRITPFIGIGYRYLNNDTGSPGGYEREIRYVYSPIGVQMVTPLSGKWTWGLAAEYDLFWGGKVKSHLSDALASLNDPEVDQDFGDGYGLRFSVRFERAFTQHFALSIEPYINYWDIDDSDIALLTEFGSPIAYVYEPENETISYGLRLGFKF